MSGGERDLGWLGEDSRSQRGGRHRNTRQSLSYLERSFASVPVKSKEKETRGAHEGWGGFVGGVDPRIARMTQ